MKNSPSRTSKSSKAIRPSHQEIALHAEALWRTLGCPQGKDEEIWFEAERQLIEDNKELLTEARR